jgi:hypothetical protein
MERMDTKEYIVKKFGLELVPDKRRVGIPMIGRDGLADLFCELEFDKGAEIGTEKGKYASVLLGNNPDLKLYCIDPWKEYLKGEGYLDVDQRVHNRHYKRTQIRLHGLNYVMIRDFSHRAVHQFEDESLDFVYIDGNHRLDYVTQDLVLWTPKVKPGGIIAGHDYIKHAGKMANHVPYALHAFMQAYSYNNFFVLGQKKRGRSREDNKHLDRIRSWFFIKDDTK